MSKHTPTMPEIVYLSDEPQRHWSFSSEIEKHPYVRVPEHMKPQDAVVLYKTQLPWIRFGESIGLMNAEHERGKLIRALRALLSPRTYDEDLDGWVIQAKSDEAKAALKLLNKIGGSYEE